MSLLYGQLHNRWFLFSSFFLQGAHQDGCNIQFRSLLCKTSAVFIHSWIRDHMKNLHFFGMVVFHRCWNISYPILFCSPSVLSVMAVLIEAMEKYPFVLSLHKRETLLWVGESGCIVLFIFSQLWISTLLRGLRGYKSYSIESSFHKSLIEFHFFVVSAYSLGWWMYRGLCSCQ